MTATPAAVATVSFNSRMTRLGEPVCVPGLGKVWPVAFERTIEARDGSGARIWKIVEAPTEGVPVIHQTKVDLVPLIRRGALSGSSEDHDGSAAEGSET